MKKSAYDKALKLLTLREHSYKELEAKLVERGFNKNEIENALSLLEEENYLSEERFVRSFVSSRLRKNVEGRTILLSRLSEKGVKREVAEPIIKEYWENEEYLEPLFKKWNSIKEESGEEKATIKMRSKGFSSYEIREAIERFSDGEK